MLIALPNPDKSFTCTLFFPFEGDLSFESLDTDDKIKDFFTTYFSDLPITVNELIGQFHESPTSSLVTIRCYPWAQQATMLLGDASHAIVPFYGQGMNAGFEDVRLLVEMASPMEFQWEDVFSAFQQSRKKDADAIADLALKNFKEMRDWVGDETFLERKKIEAQMFENFPDQWIPQYSMVTFSDIPYAQALEKGNKQEQIVEDFLKKENSGEISLNHILRVLSKD